jgi:acyl dehydratase
MKNKLKVGDKASLTKVISDDDVRQYAAICNDMNPVHLDDDFAAQSIFGQRIAHGMLVASLFSGLIGMEVPGKGTIYLGQDLKFRAPVPIGTRVTATVEVIKIRDDKPIATLRTVCVNEAGEVVIDGEAVVRVP